MLGFACIYACSTGISYIFSSCLRTTDGGWSRILPQLEIGQRLKRAARLLSPFGFQRTQIAAMPELAAMLVDHQKVHEVVRHEHVDLDVGPHNVQRRGIAHQFKHGIDQTAAAKLLRRVQGFGKFGGGVGQRH